MSVEDSHLQVPPELGDAGPHLRQVAGTVEGQLSTLASQLAPLEETWNDPGYGAHTYFQGLEQEWNTAALALFGDGVSEPGILGNLAHRLDIAWYNYCQTQQTNTKMWMH